MLCLVVSSLVCFNVTRKKRDREREEKEERLRFSGQIEVHYYFNHKLNGNLLKT